MHILTDLRLLMASARPVSQLVEFEFASLKSWNMRNPFSFWQQWSEKAAQVGHSSTCCPVDDDDEAPDDSELGELDPLRWWPLVPLTQAPSGPVMGNNKNSCHGDM